MSKLTIKPTSIHMSVAADGVVSLQLASGTGDVEVQISPDEWSKLAATAQWFEREYGDADLLASAVAERDTALAELVARKKSKK